MVISKTPLRFSILGGGSDLPAYFSHFPGGGQVISMALDTYMYVTFNNRRAYTGNADAGYVSPIRVAYTRTENVRYVSEIQHKLVKAALRSLSAIDSEGECGLPDCFEITTIGDVPSRGSGLGSSGSLLVGLLVACGGILEPDKLAKRAWMIESVYSSDSDTVGIQDQLAAAYGGLSRYEIAGSVAQIRIYQMPPETGLQLSQWLIAFRLPEERTDDAGQFTGHTRHLVMVDEMKKRAVTIKETVELVDPAWECLAMKDGIDFAGLGELMRQAWLLKLKSHHSADESDSKIATLVQEGLEHGALAGKVSGSLSAGAGHMFFLAPPVSHNRIRRHFANYAELRVGYSHEGSVLMEL